MKKFTLINNVMGWVAFAISAIVYILTTEASASFWDCGEFISTADKLLVGHPPGAPFFMIIARMFAILAPSPVYVAKMVNIMSALCSAATILFLFWSTTHLARKIFIDEHTESDGSIPAWRIWAVMGAGLVGALAYTFSDTFWFSAVEGEVYAMSSLFTAVVFWCILKWENVANESGANRWIILIAYLMGLSIGVHLLNLLCIPAIGLVYYYKKYEGRITTKGIFTALAISCVLLGAILYGIIPGLVSIAGKFELLFVNSFGLPYNSGAITWMILLLGALAYGIYYTFTHGRQILNTILTGVAVIIIGYSSFAMIVIRSASDPTMDQNSPDNVFALIDYLNREQYGDRPLFYGQTFVSTIDRARSEKEQGAPVYVKKDGKYVVAEYKPVYKYQESTCMLFPRMYSSQQSHVAQYKAWTNFTGKPVQVDDDGQRKIVNKPTFMENLTFFFRYQVGFMYMRYFMWNFSGRQNDIQSHGETIHGNWITGIAPIDNLMLGDQDLMPDYLKANRGHNVYFMLPLLLGLAGLFFQLGRGKSGMQGFWVVMLLFFMTGLAIVLYLNQTPLQPRERDYAYAGSFYAFAIWIGLGVLSIIEALRSFRLPDLSATAIASVLSLVAVPGLMAQQNWDDHDRSGCTIARDIAANYLNSCEPNAVIFTNGDNDTFPLWYAQEVEGIRTDVRVCNLSYLQTDWYADQMKRKAYLSDPLPISFTHDQYSHDRDVIYVMDLVKGRRVSLSDAIEFLRSEDPRTKRIQGHPGRYCLFPSHKFEIPVDVNQVRNSGILSQFHSNLLADDFKMTFDIKENYILKNQLFVLDMLNESKWNRPIYYAVTVGRENWCGLDNYFQLEGLAYRIVPFFGETDQMTGQGGIVNTDKMYDNVMNKFRWGFYNDPHIYLDENKTRMGSNFRSNLSRLACALISEAEHEDEYAEANPSIADSLRLSAQDKRQKALNVLEKIETELPSSAIRHNYFSIDIVECYYQLNKLDKAREILTEFATDNLQELTYYTSVARIRPDATYDSMRRNMAIFDALLRLANAYGDVQCVNTLNELYEPAFHALETLTRR